VNCPVSEDPVIRIAIPVSVRKERTFGILCPRQGPRLKASTLPKRGSLGLIHTSTVLDAFFIASQLGPVDKIAGCVEGGALEYRFKADDWETLGPGERVRRCRLWAAEALALAEKASPGMKFQYERLASEWTELALQIERYEQELSNH
jgi:hypothetical protein